MSQPSTLRVQCVSATHEAMFSTGSYYYLDYVQNGLYAAQDNKQHLRYIVIEPPNLQVGAEFNTPYFARFQVVKLIYNM